MKTQLNAAELWSRVKGLEGHTVRTLKTGHPNSIERVTETEVIIINRKSRPPRQQIEDAYRTVWEDGEIRLHSGKWRGNSRFMLAAVPAILLAAVPEHVKQITDGGLSGICLK